jgi:menaquinone-dependent protoporphyrinogen oxidase
MPIPTETVLLLFASTHGHTEKLARRLAGRIHESGASVHVVDVAEAEALDPSAYAVVVVGGSIHVDAHQPALRAWLRRFGGALDPTRTAVFSVSLTAADDSDEAQDTTAGYVAELAADAGMTPALSGSFAGALQYREYPLTTRVLMRLIARHRGLPTDTSVDVDYTDWDAVDAFGDAIAALIPRAVTV